MSHVIRGEVDECWSTICVASRDTEDIVLPKTVHKWYRSQAQGVWHCGCVYLVLVKGMGEVVTNKPKS